MSTASLEAFESLRRSSFYSEFIPKYLQAMDKAKNKLGIEKPQAAALLLVSKDEELQRWYGLSPSIIAKLDEEFFSTT